MPISTMDVIGPLLGALVFVALMSLVKEPTRRTVNVLLVAGASGVYMSGGLGVWELVYPALLFPVVYRGLQSYVWIGFAWFLHAGWDAVHHVYGNPIWPFMPTSSLGCLLFDSAIGAWFVAGAPSIWPARARQGETPGTRPGARGATR